MKLKCSLCGTTYDFFYNKDEPLQPNFPFCSQRCKSMDLGNWLNEEYRISTPPQESPLDKGDRGVTADNIQPEFAEEILFNLFLRETDPE